MPVLEPAKLGEPDEPVNQVNHELVNESSNSSIIIIISCYNWCINNIIIKASQAIHKVPMQNWYHTCMLKNSWLTSLDYVY